MNVIYEKDRHTAIIRLNSPKTLNSLSTPFMKEIADSIDEVERDKDVYVAIITGCGKSFCAGADINEMVLLNAVDMLSWSKLGAGINDNIEKSRVPYIAAVNGYALGGGCELALACDIRLASENAKFGLPEVSLGVICGAGGTQRLPRIVGEGIAKELIYTADIINAEEAYRIGLVNHVYEPEKLMEKAVALAEKIGRNGQIAVQQAKLAVTNGLNCDLSRAKEYERQAFAVCCSTEDKKIGMESFVNKSETKEFKYR